jgi:hypothetical protein
MKVKVETHTKYLARLTDNATFNVALEIPYGDPYDNTMIEETIKFQFNDDGTTIGAYLIYDQYGFDSYELPEGTYRHEFKGDERSRRSWSEENDDGEYELGNLEFYYTTLDDHHTVSYLVVESADDADGILTIPDDVPEGKRLRYATEVLTEYGQVCSGESYAFVTVKWGTDGNIVNEEACYGYFGETYALSVLGECAALMADNRFVY